LSIPPLKKKTLAGELYTRDAGIESMLSELYSLPRASLVERAQVNRASDPLYIPSECIVHLIRTSRDEEGEVWFGLLFKILSKRILNALPRATTRDGKDTSLTKESIRDEAFGRFVEILSSDRQGYDERLDFFEIKFNGALEKLRLTAQKRAWLAEKRYASLESDDEGVDLSPEVEQAACAFDPFNVSDLQSRSYRLRLNAAINQLSPLQRRIIHMLRQGFQIDSNDADTMTIVKAVKRSEKTVRTHRDLAFAIIRDSMKGGTL
jgi:DNA-directed RNA polymerase specialized sigma24 family protein